MYLHLGNDTVVNMNDIVGVFDMENTTITKQGRRFLTEAQKNGQVVYTANDLPKSYIVTQHCGETTVYVSSISSATLLKRAKSSQIVILED